MCIPFESKQQQKTISTLLHQCCIIQFTWVAFKAYMRVRELNRLYPYNKKEQSDIFDDDRLCTKSSSHGNDTKARSKREKWHHSLNISQLFFVCLLCWHWNSHMERDKPHIFDCYHFISTFIILVSVFLFTTQEHH